MGAAGAVLALDGVDCGQRTRKRPPQLVSLLALASAQSCPRTMPTEKDSWKTLAMKAAAKISGAKPSEIFIEVQGSVVFVNWQDSMKVGADTRALVAQAVSDVLPPEHKLKTVSVN